MLTHASNFSHPHILPHFLSYLYCFLYNFPLQSLYIYTTKHSEHINAYTYLFICYEIKHVTDLLCVSDWKDNWMGCELLIQSQCWDQAHRHKVKALHVYQSLTNQAWHQREMASMCEGYKIIIKVQSNKS